MLKFVFVLNPPKAKLRQMLLHVIKKPYVVEKVVERKMLKNSFSSSFFSSEQFGNNFTRELVGNAISSNQSNGKSQNAANQLFEALKSTMGGKVLVFLDTHYLDFQSTVALLHCCTTALLQCQDTEIVAVSALILANLNSQFEEEFLRKIWLSRS